MLVYPSCTNSKSASDEPASPRSMNKELNGGDGALAPKAKRRLSSSISSPDMTSLFAQLRPIVSP